MSKKVNYGVSTELTRINIEEILANYKKPNFWKKKWCVFKTRDFDCIWEMYYINVKDNTITSKVTLNYKGKKNVGYYSGSSDFCRSIPIDHEEYNDILLQQNILGSVLAVIRYLEQEICKHSYEYKEALRLEEDEEERLREIAEDFLDGENVSNEDIREAYIEKYVSDSKTFDYTDRILGQCERKYYPTARLMACSWFNNKKRFEEEKEIVVEKNEKIKKKYIYEIWKNRKMLDSNEYREEMEDCLEPI